MNDYYWYGEKLKSELLGLSDVKRLRLASAYLSNYGFETLQTIINNNNIDKDNVEIFLSPEFSYEPGLLLDKLSSLGKIFIVFDIPFHAKVILIERINESKLIYGSSNFTRGGIETNLEFDIIKTASIEDIKQVKNFFDYCTNNSKPLSSEIIDEYNNNQKELDKLKKIEEQLRKQLYSYNH
jgi:phosphatidylserine/phosphatidylglycerophosphate/cardiolipin synthase-like enzyme